LTRDAHPPDTRRQEHWESVYSDTDAHEVSWYQASPGVSVRLIQAAAAGLGGAVVDAGGGASRLAGSLAAAGFTDVSVVDVCGRALAAARRDNAGRDSIDWIQADLLQWRPRRCYQVWHDRAAFHFLTTAADRAAYFATVRAALPAGGTIIIGTFAADGPEKCSGLPVARYGHESLATEVAAAFGSAVTITGRDSETHSTPSGTIQPFTWITARLR
jgi:SAM-dependent methyltransferase